MGLLDMLNKGGGLFDPIAQSSDRGFDLQKMMANTEPMNAPQFAPPQERGQGRGGVFGSGYSGEDIMSMLLRAAAIAQGDYGAGAQFGQNIGAKARADAEAAAAERQRQLERQEGNQDYETRLGMAQRYKAPADPYRFEDNAGNVWERGPDGENRRIFTDLAPRQFVQDGQVVTVPNPFAGAQAGGGVEEGQTATNPQTGEKLMFRGGQWVPAGGGTGNGVGGFRP